MEPNDFLSYNQSAQVRCGEEGTMAPNLSLAGRMGTVAGLSCASAHNSLKDAPDDESLQQAGLHTFNSLIEQVASAPNMDHWSSVASSIS